MTTYTLRPFLRLLLELFIFGVVGLSTLCISPLFASAVATSSIYQSDFSSDPNWITDQPANFHWDSAEGALFAHTTNRPDPSYSPSRHYYTETTLNPKLSYELSWDMKILTVQGGNTSGVALFGMYGDRLHSFNKFTTNFGGNDQDGTFSTRLMTLDGQSRFIWTGVNPGYNYDIGVVHQSANFSLDTWYRFHERYDALSHRYYFEIRDRASDTVVFSYTIQALASEPVNPALQNLGISMHPEGGGGTNLGVSTRIDGFTEYLIDNVSLTQIHDETYTQPSSVLFLPGIQSSRLYRDGLIGEDQVWEPNINGDVSQIAMSAGGVSEQDIYTRDVIDSALGFVPIYKDFIPYLAKLKIDGIVSDQEVYAYDWRYSVGDIVKNGTRYETEQKYLVERVKALAKNNNSHVTIIGHSNGGLLAKALVKELESQGLAYLVDKVILVATPELGTPKVLGALLHGLDQQQLGGLLIDDETARDTMRNMPGAYGLVPSAKYFEGGNGQGIVTFDTKPSTAAFVNTYGTSIDSRDELIDFLSGTDGRAAATAINQPSVVNATMAGEAQTLHDTVLDPWVAPAPIQVIEIVGVGLDTVKGLHYTEFEKQQCLSAGPAGIVCDHDVYYEPVPVLTRYGDETVVKTSANAYPGNKQVYYLNLDQLQLIDKPRAVGHSDIMNLTELQQMLTGLLQNQNVSVPFFSTSMPTFTESRDLIAVHSPVALSAQDSAGRVVGKVGSGESQKVVTDIPGSSYLEFGGGKYVVVPSAASYEVVIQGQGEAGSYTLSIDKLVGEAPPAPVAQFLATTTPTMIATLTKGGGVFSDLRIDYTRDGTIDEVQTVAPEATTSALFSALRTLFGSFSKLKPSERASLIGNVDKAEQAGIRKGYGSSGVLRIFSSIDDKLIQYRTQTRISVVEYTSAKGLMDKIITR